jgi:RNA polymerase primary sigma factor
MTENSDSENKIKNDENSLDNLVKSSKDKGFVTYDEINNAIPNDKKMSVDDLEQVISKFSDAGIEFLEDDEDIKLDINIDEEVIISTTNVDSEADIEEEAEEIGSSTDDPVRLYLRDMGGVELLSREGEIEIAKKIEEGQEIMMRSLCESPVTMKQLIKWYEDLVNEKIMLRDLIDFESNIAEESVNL